MIEWRFFFWESDLHKKKTYFCEFFCLNVAIFNHRSVVIYD